MCTFFILYFRILNIKITELRFSLIFSKDFFNIKYIFYTFFKLCRGDNLKSSFQGRQYIFIWCQYLVQTSMKSCHQELYSSKPKKCVKEQYFFFMDQVYKT